MRHSRLLFNFVTSGVRLDMGFSSCLLALSSISGNIVVGFSASTACPQLTTSCPKVQPLFLMDSGTCNKNYAIIQSL